MKKGFTLAELLGVIVVLALISLVTVPAVSDVLKNNKKKLCETQLQNIKLAAQNYGADHFYDLPVESGSENGLTIYLRDLTSNGYIDKEIRNPVRKSDDIDAYFAEDEEITITKDGNKFIYKIQNEEDLCN